MKKIIFYLLAYIIPSLSNGQGIPKGYDPFIRVVPPDTLTRATDVFWAFDNQKYLFVQYDYGSKILVIDTDVWKNVKWYENKDKYSTFYAFAENFNILVLERFKTFLFFSSLKYKFLNFMTGESKYLNAKKLKKYISQNGKLDGGRSFHLRSSIFSPDNNYYVLNPNLFSSFYDADQPQQKHFEIRIYKYKGCP